MLKKPKQLYLCFITGLFLFSCNSGTSLKESGTVVYHITYPNDSLNTKTLPTQMTIRYKNSMIFTQIEGLSGMVNITYIENRETKVSHYLIKLLNKKLYYTDSTGSVGASFLYQDMPSITITPEDGIKKILGYNCHIAKFHINDSSQATFDVYYTKDIGQPNPNVDTPFEQIDGVMLQFGMLLANKKVIIAASKIENDGLDNSNFAVPSGYKRINKETLLEVFKLFKL